MYDYIIFHILLIFIYFKIYYGVLLNNIRIYYCEYFSKKQKMISKLHPKTPYCNWYAQNIM